MSRARRARRPRAEPLGVNPRVAVARTPSPPASSPRRSAASSPTATARRSSTRAASRFAPRSIRRCSRWRARRWSTALSLRRGAWLARRRSQQHRLTSRDWGLALADVPALGDVQPWRLAVVLDADGRRPASACSPTREKSGAVEREREIGARSPADGVKWTRASRRARSLARRRRHLCRADRRQAAAVPAAPDAGGLAARSSRWTPTPAACSPWSAASPSTSPSSIARRRRCASRAPRSSPSSMPRRSTTAIRRPPSSSTRRSRSTRARPGGVASGELRRQVQRPAHAALRHRTFART